MNHRKLPLPGIFMLLLLLPFAAQAKPVTSDWIAVQGQVIELDADALPAGPVSLRVFGHEWPVKREPGGAIHAWVGVDLARKPGRYRLSWHIGKGAKAEHRLGHLTVTKGSFRVSRITVPKGMAVFTTRTLALVRADQRATLRAYQVPVQATPDIRMKQWPVMGVISTPFGARRFVNGEPRSPHIGIDIAVPVGTPIHAPLAGRVVLTRKMYLDGNTVIIGHGYGLYSIYCHLSHMAVKKGDWVKAGELIGETGMTGRTTGPHLHWGVHFERARVNPESLLPATAVAAINAAAARYARNHHE
jgi:murein DD-endopeptidase MepM/ murein hydrolase activator NlpD